MTILHICKRDLFRLSGANLICPNPSERGIVRMDNNYNRSKYNKYRINKVRISPRNWCKQSRGLAFLYIFLKLKGNHKVL